jgi:DNA-binding response OmpR family regulator
MPDLSGLDVINAVDELEKRPYLGLITGWSGKIETKEKEELKADFILKKPFDLAKLTNLINDVIDAAEYDS